MDGSFAEEDEEEGSEGAGEPLILRIDPDDQGSVGSEDTSRFDSDDELAHPGEEGLPPWHASVYMHAQNQRVYSLSVLHQHVLSGILNTCSLE